MDFTFDEEQQAVREAAEGIFAGLVNPERVQEVEASEDRFDRELWAELARADLLGLAVPEAYGRWRLRHGRACLLLEAQGRCVAPVPLWATLVLGAMPIAEFGSDAPAPRACPGWWPGEPCSPPRWPTWPTTSPSAARADRRCAASPVRRRLAA